MIHFLLGHHRDRLEDERSELLDFASTDGSIEGRGIVSQRIVSTSKQECKKTSAREDNSQAPRNILK